MSFELQTAAEERAHALAKEEDLNLIPADNAAGYKGVSPNNNGTSFTVRKRENGRDVHLGTFSTAAEAALCYARHVGSDRVRAEAARMDPRTDPNFGQRGGVAPPLQVTPFVSPVPLRRVGGRGA